MKSVIRCGLVFSIMCCITTMMGAQENKPIDWSDPEKIDPMQEGIGSFLDTELYTYIQKAHHLYWSKMYVEAAQHFSYRMGLHQCCKSGDIGEHDGGDQLFDRPAILPLPSHIGCLIPCCLGHQGAQNLL